MTQPVWKQEYPFESHWLALKSGPKLHYIDHGVRDSVQGPILAVHGNPTWSFYYRSIATRFESSNRVIALDHIGCGLSDKPQQYPYSLSTHTSNLVALIDHLGIQDITLVVHDWGGAIGLGAAVQRPDRFSNILVLNTGAFPPPYIPLRIAACRWPWIGTAAMRHLNLFALAATRMAIHRLPRLSESARLGLLAPYDSYQNRVGIDRFVHDIPMHRGHPTYATLEKLEQDLPKLADKNIHFLWGMQDWCFRPECMERLQKSLPKATRTELADVGHYVMEEAQAEVESSLRKLMSR